MPKNYDAKNTGRDGKIKHPAQPRCATCAGKRQVRVSKPRDTHSAPARQTYDIVWVKCPDC